ncbi:MAG: membrane protein insertion efficiency factor YidD, partial [Candidatus Acidiferrales bacterium]
MGHRDSPATLGGGGALRASGSGTRAPAARPEAPRVSLPARALLFLLRVYQSFFSALMPSACKFYPTCSHYAV